MKNVIKAVKKLRYWAKKKRKKRLEHGHEHEPHYCCCSCSSSNTQPSAPPLPSSWLHVEEHSYGTFLPEPKVAQLQDSSPVSCTSNSSSYHQYMVSVSEPVYGIPVPVSHTAARGKTERERSTGQFGCVFSFGSYLFRCLFPCFHTREVV
ncbi:unnamed protein product [Sphenostylis stenocarpa]|uniref:Uncharacterized protein n=1 Tax=Sphenostylis stenocarpa TaxID=92480 RepID=A0AA86T271_9FABA|nr:unnamed protein product [Sphenostylis stenocarpa]